ncbi:hypothetical protein ACFV4N_32905 [Actinosynnema sp. NPDC059797]
MRRRLGAVLVAVAACCATPVPAAAQPAEVAPGGTRGRTESDRLAGDGCEVFPSLRPAGWRGSGVRGSATGPACAALAPAGLRLTRST